MNKIVTAVVLVSVCGTLNACSAKLEGTPGPANFSFSGDLPPTTKAPTPPDAGPVYSAPTQCIDLSGSYQINSDSFTITQSNCDSGTWVWHGNEYLGTQDHTDAYAADDVERQVSDLTVGEQIFQKSHFEATSFVVEERVVTASATNQVKRVYTFTKTPCDLLNPDPAVMYLSEQMYQDGSAAQTGCTFWVRSAN